LTKKTVSARRKKKNRTRRLDFETGGSAKRSPRGGL